MNNIANRQVMCQVLMEKAKDDRDIVVLCSDSRGSASLAPFAQAFPAQFVEVGIAEQNLVGIASGLALCGKKAFAVAPASFLSTRSYEQVKVDCAYSGANVKLVGISGGVSYGALGMTHHACQDIAAMAAIPGLGVYLPSDRHQTRRLFERLAADDRPCYVRLGRNPVADVYDEAAPFQMDKATWIRRGGDACLIACGEMVAPAAAAAALLAREGISCTVLDMYCLKPLDQAAIADAARDAKLVVTVEEHAPFGGLHALVSQVLCENSPRPVIGLTLPDRPVIAGTSAQVFDHYGLNAQGIASAVRRRLKG